MGPSTSQNEPDGQTQPAVPGSESHDFLQADSCELSTPPLIAHSGGQASAPAATPNASSTLVPPDQPMAASPPASSKPLANHLSMTSSSSSSVSSGTASEDDEDFGAPASLPGGRRLCGANLSWNEADESLLKACVERHGTDWPSVTKSFNCRSEIPRTAGGLSRRWVKLSETSIHPTKPRQQTSLPSKSSSSSQATGGQLGPKPSTSSSGSLTSQPWTDQETSTLRRIFFRHVEAGSPISYNTVHADYLNVYPRSTRSAGAIRKKCYTFLPELSSPASSPGQANLQSAASTSRAPATRLSTGSILRSNDQAHRGRLATLSSRFGVQASQAPSSHAAQAAFPHQSHPEAHHQAPLNASQDVDVDVRHAPGGVTVRCPRGFEVRVYSPSHVNVSRQDTSSTEDPEAAF